jgi:hypothetical protein
MTDSNRLFNANQGFQRSQSAGLEVFALERKLNKGNHIVLIHGLSFLAWFICLVWTFVPRGVWGFHPGKDIQKKEVRSSYVGFLMSSKQ